MCLCHSEGKTLISSGWYSKALKVPSPNYNVRPQGVPVSLLVIHNISLPPGQYGGGHIQKFFCNQLDPSVHPYFTSICDMQVSAHCLIERSGNVTQFVDFNNRAWHAGRSSFAGVEECNDYSIGIELEGTDLEDYTHNQYEALTDLSQYLLAEYPELTVSRITGHSDIAPGRKTDPGAAFNWEQYKNMLTKNQERF